MAADRILSIDQGTTSTRAILFDREGRPLAEARRALKQIYPQEGWVEHDPREIWEATLAVSREAVAMGGGPAPVAAIGLTNQRETTLLWDRKSGAPLHNAIVWQDRRTAELCRRMRDAGLEKSLTDKTGLLVDPYFSATKLGWLLDNVDGARARAERGELAFGTVDSWLIWNFTQGKCHYTDVTNASRTLLFNIRDLDWDREILDRLCIPSALLPEVRECAADFGVAAEELLGARIPIRGVAGDQQSAAIGQACTRPGMMKVTYGTGGFALLHIGPECLRSEARLLTTVGYVVREQMAYALEGSIFMAGATLDWLKDNLKLFSSLTDAEKLARNAPDSSVYFVPAFVGLGAPHWDPAARGAVFGLTRDSGIGDVVRAAFDAVCYQTRDLIAAMAADKANPPDIIRVDGGMSANDGFLQRLADLTGARVERPHFIETTALGAFSLASIGAGTIGDLDDLHQISQISASFEPRLDGARRDALYAGWREAVERTKTQRKAGAT